MASLRIMGLSTTVKIARRMTAVKQWGGLPPTNKCRSIHCNTHYDVRENLDTVDVADLLSMPERDFLARSNGKKVAISSLKGKLVGLYFCDNIPYPPRMQAIKKVYEEAKSRGYDFEIVQLTFHYRCNFNAKHLGIDPTVLQCREDISWLTLPLMDPMDTSFTKIKRIFESIVDLDDEDKKTNWVGDSLALVYPHRALADCYDVNGVPFEFSGADILKRWGIEGYPFTRQSLYKAEYELQKRGVTLESLFPPGECLLRIPSRRPWSGFDLVDGFPQLWGKRVLVLFASHFAGSPESGYEFRRMLKSVYRAQLKDDVAEESKFEVVYISTGDKESEFDEFTKDMPWLVRPFSYSYLLWKVFKSYAKLPAAAVFNELGELIAKEDDLVEKKRGRFPFIDQDFEKFIRREVDTICDDVDYNRDEF